MIDFRFALFIPLIIALLGFNANAQNVRQSYESFAKYADKVVHGKVIASQPIKSYQDGKEIDCGVYMEIEVTKSIRGGTDNFLLYSTHSDIFVEDKDREFFIFAFKNEAFSPGGRAENFVLCEGLNSSKKNLAPFEYISDTSVQRIFPLRKEENTLKDWMQIMARLSNAQLPEAIERKSVKNENISVIEEMSLAQFLKEYIPEN